MDISTCISTFLKQSFWIQREQLDTGRWYQTYSNSKYYENAFQTYYCEVRKCKSKLTYSTFIENYSAYVHG